LYVIAYRETVGHDHASLHYEITAFGEKINTANVENFAFEIIFDKYIIVFQSALNV
jgi:hypothetical protein